MVAPTWAKPHPCSRHPPGHHRRRARQGAAPTRAPGNGRHGALARPRRAAVSAERTLGEQGLHEALDRLQARMDNPVLGDPRIAVAEVLEWSYALQEYHVDQLRLAYRGDDKKAWAYFDAQRNGNDDGETHAALVWFRGQSTHALVSGAGLIPAPGPPARPVVHDRDGHLSSSATQPSALVNQWRWKRLSELEERTDRFKLGREKLYEKHVAGRAVIPPLKAAENFLTSYTP